MWQTEYILFKALARQNAKRFLTLFLRLTDAPLLFSLWSKKEALEAELTCGLEGGFHGVAMFVLLENCGDSRDAGDRVDGFFM